MTEPAATIPPLPARAALATGAVLAALSTTTDHTERVLLLSGYALGGVVELGAFIAARLKARRRRRHAQRMREGRANAGIFDEPTRDRSDEQEEG